MLKYIKHHELGMILFSKSVDHITIANYLGGKDKVVSAGFVIKVENYFACAGQSNTLRVGSHESDSELLELLME